MKKKGAQLGGRHGGGGGGGRWGKGGYCQGFSSKPKRRMSKPYGVYLRENM